MRHLFLFGKKVSFEFIKFGLVGVLNTLIHLLVLFVLVEYFSVYYVLASFLAFALAVTNSFVLNTIWTFRQDLCHRTVFRYGKFFVMSSLAAVVNLSLLYLITEYLGVWYLLSQVFATGFSLFVNFLGNKFWTFR